ncbi:HPr family phosphocarrier protein [Actinoplanes oblitus]|uniref:Phosphocarrier protein HPr n=1 Tax=Actinoplanes oblitus TaxID=3040509 RepID=A0ABY8WEA7_9ACTN|nr:HPr family phosphocarrier protein [Actinoplanes oblitus]WIM94065.1 HPr family phosphocarrier protein [Actinoplanes oblitus]
MSTSSEIPVTLPAALHARPAGEVVRTAARFPDTTISVRHGERTVPARSALKLMSLGADTGATVVVIATGDDALAAAEAVAEALRATE